MAKELGISRQTVYNYKIV
ncbi:MAG: hypothetical protein WA488_13870 [Mycobacterium sp.]